MDRELTIRASLCYFEQRATVTVQKEVIWDFEEINDIILSLRI